MDEAEKEEIIDRIGRALDISWEETHTMLQNALKSDNLQDGLIDLLGYDLIEDIFYILEHTELFVGERVKEERHYVEHVLEPEKPFKPDTKSLVKTSVIGEESKFFPYEKFNTLQSAVFSSIWESTGNVLVAAPTGSGKTDVALLGILRSLKKGEKAVYIAPMKALASEIVGKLRERLKNKHKVVEVTGDTKGEAIDFAKSDVVVCTPEKLDVMTRRLGCVALKGIGTVVIDEIHLLGERRGAVLEALTQRLRSIGERNQLLIRFIGLSATLPNYKDVALFLEAPHIFHFDQKYRPVPLRTTIVGFRKDSKRKHWEEYLVAFLKKMIRKEKQVLLFVTSRARTAKIAKWIIDEEILEVRGKDTTNQLNFFASHGIGIHHAGMSRDERKVVEEEFKKGKLGILVCTTTLAWGVNLPAHAVVIYGTSFYNQGTAHQLSILDVVQIFGRAGRPQYNDTEGSALLMTEAVHVPEYLQQLRESKDIESSLLYALPEAISAEVYLRNILSYNDVVRWISGTFLYIRMSKNPALYGVIISQNNSISAALDDYIQLTLQRLQSSAMISLLEPYRAHSKSSKTVSHSLISLDLHSTPLGRIAAVYYVSHHTIYAWMQEISIPSGFTERTIASILLNSYEFSEMTARPEESQALEKAAEQLILRRIIDSEFDGTLESKLLVLLYSHISFLKLSLFTLHSDLSFLLDTLDRLIPAFCEMLALMDRLDEFRLTVELMRKVESAKWWFSKELECSSPKVLCTRVCDFVDLIVEWPNTTYIRIPRQSFGDSNETAIRQHLKEQPVRISIVLYRNNKVTYCATSESYFREMIPVKGDNLVLEVFCCGRHWKIPLDVHTDYSPKAFLKYGVHYCDSLVKITKPNTKCPHFTHTASSLLDYNNAPSIETYNNSCSYSFTLNLDFVVVDGGDFREQLLHIDYLVSRASYPFLYICSSKSEAYHAASLITTLRALRHCYDKVEVWNKSSTTSCSTISFSDASKAVSNYSNIIFRGCRTRSDFYPIIKLFALSNAKHALIYEKQEFIEYLKRVLE